MFGELFVSAEPVIGALVVTPIPNVWGHKSADILATPSRIVKVTTQIKESLSAHLTVVNRPSAISEENILTMIPPRSVANQHLDKGKVPQLLQCELVSLCNDDPIVHASLDFELEEFNVINFKPLKNQFYQAQPQHNTILVELDAPAIAKAFFVQSHLINDGVFIVTLSCGVYKKDGKMTGYCVLSTPRCVLPINRKIQLQSFFY